MPILKCLRFLCVNKNGIFNWTDGDQWKPFMHAVSICLLWEIHVRYMLQEMWERCQFCFKYFILLWCCTLSNLFSVKYSTPERVNRWLLKHPSTMYQLVIVTFQATGGECLIPEIFLVKYHFKVTIQTHTWTFLSYFCHWQSVICCFCPWQCFKSFQIRNKNEP